MDTPEPPLQVGQCVTFLETQGALSKYVGIVIRKKEVLKIGVAEVLWNDGTVMIIAINSLRAL